MSHSDDSSNDPRPAGSVLSADPPRNFSLSVGERIRALTIGAPAYSTRKKSIEDLEALCVQRLIALNDALAARAAEPDVIAQALSAKANTFDLKKLNTLIETHNRYYPIEANLAIDPKSGEYLVVGRRWLPEEPCTPTKLLARVRALLEERVV